MTDFDQLRSEWPAGESTSKLASAKVLVTGATGFIGSLLVSRLSSIGCQGTILVEKQINSEVSGFDVHVGDICSHDALIDASKDAEIVYHLAAFTDPDAKSREDVERCFAVNVEGTSNLLASLGPLTEHVVFFSTVYVFGCQSGESIDEAYPANPSTAYGRYKLEAENLVQEWGSRHGLMTTCLRLPLVYGPGNKGNVLRMIDAIARRRFPVIGKGDNKRSMVYVENVVDAAIAVAYREEANGELFIVTDVTDYSILDLYQTISRSLGIRPLPLRAPAPVARLAGRAFDLAARVSGIDLPYNSQVLNRLTASLTFSAKKIEETVGFRPRYALREGMEETVRWYKDNKQRCSGYL